MLAWARKWLSRAIREILKHKIFITIRTLNSYAIKVTMNSQIHK